MEAQRGPFELDTLRQRSTSSPLIIIWWKKQRSDLEPDTYAVAVPHMFISTVAFAHTRFNDCGLRVQTPPRQPPTAVVELCFCKQPDSRGSANPAEFQTPDNWVALRNAVFVYSVDQVTRWLATNNLESWNTAFCGTEPNQLCHFVWSLKEDNFLCWFMINLYDVRCLWCPVDLSRRGRWSL